MQQALSMVAASERMTEKEKPKMMVPSQPQQLSRREKHNKKLRTLRSPEGPDLYIKNSIYNYHKCMYTKKHPRPDPKKQNYSRNPEEFQKDAKAWLENFEHVLYEKFFKVYVQRAHDNLTLSGHIQ